MLEEDCKLRGNNDLKEKEIEHAHGIIKNQFTMCEILSNL